MVGKWLLRWKQYRENQKREQEFRRRRKKLNSTHFAIIANNCWAGEVYKYYNLPFTTPFIGLFLYPDCYLRLLENWSKIDLGAIQIQHKSKYHDTERSYPVGLLDGGNIEVHFLHYHSDEEALAKWTKRSKRLAQFSENELFFKFCDRDEATESHFERFAALPFRNRLAISARIYPFLCQVSAKAEEGKNTVEDGVVLFATQMAADFPLHRWLNRNLFPGQAD